MRKMFLSTPLTYNDEKGTSGLNRTLCDIVAMLDNLVELIIFTPRGIFPADPDFGFEYWNHEYSNIYLKDFSNGQKTISTEVTKLACEESVRDSLATYMPSLKHVTVEMKLLAISSEERAERKTKSKYEVTIEVRGDLDNGLGTTHPYENTVRFLMEPTIRLRTI